MSAGKASVLDLIIELEFDNDAKVMCSYCGWSGINGDLLVRDVAIPGSSGSCRLCPGCEFPFRWPAQTYTIMSPREWQKIASDTDS